MEDKAANGPFSPAIEVLTSHSTANKHPFVFRVRTRYSTVSLLLLSEVILFL